MLSVVVGCLIGLAVNYAFRKMAIALYRPISTSAVEQIENEDHRDDGEERRSGMPAREKPGGKTRRTAGVMRSRPDGDDAYPPSDRAFDRRIALIFSLRLTAEGFSYRSRRRSSRFSPERSRIFRSRRTAS